MIATKILHGSRGICMKIHSGIRLVSLAALGAAGIALALQ